MEVKAMLYDKLPGTTTNTVKAKYYIEDSEGQVLQQTQWRPGTKLNIVKARTVNARYYIEHSEGQVLQQTQWGPVLH